MSTVTVSVTVDDLDRDYTTTSSNLSSNSASGYSATADDVARLHNDLFMNYRRVIPPVYNQTHAVKVRLSLFLLMIHDLVSHSLRLPVCIHLLFRLFLSLSSSWSVISLSASIYLSVCRSIRVLAWLFVLVTDPWPGRSVCVSACMCLPVCWSPACLLIIYTAVRVGAGERSQSENWWRTRI